MLRPKLRMLRLKMGMLLLKIRLLRLQTGQPTRERTNLRRVLPLCLRAGVGCGGDLLLQRRAAAHLASEPFLERCLVSGGGRQLLFDACARR